MAHYFSFDGAERSCDQWKMTRKGYRCAHFDPKLRRPTLPAKGLKGGGRSQHYIRGKKKTCAPTKRCKP